MYMYIPIYVCMCGWPESPDIAHRPAKLPKDSRFSDGMRQV